jgi:hypothetical protein
MGSRYRERAKAATQATLPTRETQVLLAITVVTAAIVVALFGGWSPSHNTGLFVALLLVLSAGFISRALPRRRLSSEQALFLVELGDIAGAAESALRTLRARVPGDGQARAWLVLTRCAELEADFAEVVELVNTALVAVDSRTMLAREMVERSAFALAAIGRTHEASMALGVDTFEQGPFRTASRAREWSPLGFRAAVLCLQRRGDHQGVRDLCETEGPKAMHELPPRDRALVRGIAKWAGASLQTIFLTEGEREPAILRWTERVLSAC